ncbi:MAG: nuclear transport factor 2 family protein [Roseibacillus sp.]
MKSYRDAMTRAGSDGPASGSAAEKAAHERFGTFLKNVGIPSAIKENTSKTYAKEAYLNDTLVTHYGPEEIEAYFLKTADTMTEFEVTIDDVARSGDDHYFRWTMIFAAPKLAKGTPIHSVGMSQVRFNAEGKVVFHQDFWDSGANIFGQAPVSGGIIGAIRKRIAK